MRNMSIYFNLIYYYWLTNFGEVEYHFYGIIRIRENHIFTVYRNKCHKNNKIMSEELNTPTDEALNNRIPLSLLEVFFK